MATADANLKDSEDYLCGSHNIIRPNKKISNVPGDSKKKKIYIYRFFKDALSEKFPGNCN